jgi:hypothetical protein
VTLDDTLALVTADVDRGELAAARRRLRELLVSRPHRLDVRERLAQIYRGMGEPAQAGRWGYLSDDVPPHELQAFQSACDGDAALMLEALAWGEDDDGLHADMAEFAQDEAQVTPTARARVAQLRRLAIASIAVERVPIVSQIPVEGPLPTAGQPPATGQVENQVPVARRVMAAAGDVPDGGETLAAARRSPLAAAPEMRAAREPLTEMPVGRQRSPLAPSSPGRETGGRAGGTAGDVEQPDRGPVTEPQIRPAARLRERLGVALIIVGIVVVLITMLAVLVAIVLGIAWGVRQIHT